MSNSLKGKRIAFTGKVDDFTRADFEAMAEEYDFNFDKSVTQHTDILVKGKNPGKTKIDAAAKYRTRIWDAEDFILMLSADDDAGIPVAPRELTEEEKRERADFYEADASAGMF